MNESQSGRASRITSFLLGAMIAGVLCFIAGALYGNLAPYHNVLVKESELANKVIDSDPEFSGLHLVHASIGTVMFAGTVPTSETYSKLQAAVIDQFGRIDLEMRMLNVEVANQKKPTQR